MIDHGKTFYSPVAVNTYVLEASQDPSFSLKKPAEIKQVIEINVGAMAALLMHSINGFQVYVQLHRPDPPDVIVRLVDNKDIAHGLITLLEITEYLKGSSETLLEQLKRKKIPEKYDPFGGEYIVVVHVEPGATVEIEPLRQYLESNNKKFPVWLIEKKNASPDTVVEFTIVNPQTMKQVVNLGKLAFDYQQKRYPYIIELARTGTAEKARFEKLDKGYPPPWEMIGK